MDNSSCRAMQETLLVMLKWFHQVCCDNNLRYYALGGTMLGALRHKGFIPWDDDIDVGMPRSDYELLKDVMKKLPKSKYVLETPDSPAEDFVYCFSKLYDTETTLVENTKHKIRRGIYIDIFPLDGMGNSESEAKKTFSVIDRKFKLILAHTTAMRKGRSILENAAVITSQLFLSPFIDEKRTIVKINELSAKKSFDKCIYGGNPFGAWRYKEIMPTDVMGQPTLYEFEDTNIYGAEKADLYLTSLYGDWRKLPPTEKRVSHHDYISLDLYTPYVSAKDL